MIRRDDGFNGDLGGGANERCDDQRRENKGIVKYFHAIDEEWCRWHLANCHGTAITRSATGNQGQNPTMELRQASSLVHAHHLRILHDDRRALPSDDARILKFNFFRVTHR